TITSPARTTRAVTLGTRSVRCASRRSRLSSRSSPSGADKGSQRARNRVERGLDVPGGDIEMGHRAKHVLSRCEGEEHALGPETGDRVVGAEPQRAHVEQDEVRLDLRRVDGQAGGKAPLA